MKGEKKMKGETVKRVMDRKGERCRELLGGQFKQEIQTDRRHALW